MFTEFISDAFQSVENWKFFKHSNFLFFFLVTNHDFSAFWENLGS